MRIIVGQPREGLSSNPRIEAGLQRQILLRVLSPQLSTEADLQHPALLLVLSRSPQEKSEALHPSGIPSGIPSCPRSLAPVLTPAQLAAVQAATVRATRPVGSFYTHTATYQTLGLRLDGLVDRIRNMWAALGQEITHGPQQTETDYVASANMALDLLDSVRNQNVRLHGTYVNYLRGSGIPLDANTTGRGDTRAFDLDQYNAQAAADNGTLDTYIAETHFISEFIDSVVTMTTNSESMLEWLAHVRTGTNADATQFDIQRNRIMALMQHVRDLQYVGQAIGHTPLPAPLGERYGDEDVDGARDAVENWSLEVVAGLAMHEDEDMYEVEYPDHIGKGKGKQ